MRLSQPQSDLLDEIREAGILYVWRYKRYGRTAQALERRGLVFVKERDLSGQGADGWAVVEP